MPARSPDRSRSIGAVLAEVRAEFPEVTISKIRFLETAGLLEPTRTAAGYRQYDPAQVERLRYILRAQRDRFWPLKVIREALDALERGLAPQADDLVPRAPVAVDDVDVQEAPGPMAGTATAPQPRPVRLTDTELADSAQVTTSAVAAIVAHGLISPDSAGHYDEYALRVVHAVTGLAAFGLEPRHLRPFRTAADREIGLVHQAAAGAGHHEEATHEVTRLCLQLHAALLKGGLSAS